MQFHFNPSQECLLQLLLEYNIDTTYDATTETVTCNNWQKFTQTAIDVLAPWQFVQLMSAITFVQHN